MATSMSNIEKRLIGMIRADLSSPSTSDIGNLHLDMIYQWSNELSSMIIEGLAVRRLDDGSKHIDNYHVQSLVAPDANITFTAGSSSLISDYYALISLRANGRNVKILDSEQDFYSYDGKNFLTNPSSNYPVGIVTGGTIKVKPTSIIFGQMSYLKIHPEMGLSKGTLWSGYGDKVLLEFLLSKYYLHKNNTERASFHEKTGRELMNV